MNFAAGFALSAMLVGMSWPAQACTTFWTEYQGRSFVGKNYDWDQESALLLFNKVGQKKQSLNFNPGNKPTEWTSKYASLTFNQYGREMPNGGMNMAGLVVEIMWFNRTRYPRVDERPSINELQWIQYQLDNFSSTQEVIQHAGKLRVAPIYAKVHYLVCDKIGHCAAFEYLNHKLVISPHAKALTNSSYARSAAYLKQVGPGEMKGASTSSLNRFANARRGSRAKKSSPFELLEKVRQGDYTKWQIVYEPKTLTVRFRTTSHSAIKTVRLRGLDGRCKTPVQMLNINDRKKGDVTDDFGPYTQDANYALLQETTAAIQHHLPPGSVWLLSRYPNLTQCMRK